MLCDCFCLLLLPLPVALSFPPSCCFPPSSPQPPYHPRVSFYIHTATERPTPTPRRMTSHGRAGPLDQKMVMRTKME